LKEHILQGANKARLEEVNKARLEEVHKARLEEVNKAALKGRDFSPAINTINQGGFSH
jgi:hypothetical protein